MLRDHEQVAVLVRPEDGAAWRPAILVAIGTTLRGEVVATCEWINAAGRLVAGDFGNGSVRSVNPGT